MLVTQVTRTCSRDRCRSMEIDVKTAVCGLPVYPFPGSDALGVLKRFPPRTACGTAGYTRTHGYTWAVPSTPVEKWDALERKWDDLLLRIILVISRTIKFKVGRVGT